MRSRSPNQTRIRTRCLFFFHFENLLNKLEKSSYTNMHVQNTFAVHSASLRLYRATDATNTVLHSPPEQTLSQSGPRQGHKVRLSLRYAVPRLSSPPKHLGTLIVSVIDPFKGNPKQYWEPSLNPKALTRLRVKKKIRRSELHVS